MKFGVIIASILALLGVGWVALSVSGEGSFKRMMTISGIYTICKPDGYDVVCFLDADGKEGGVYCLPLAQAGGKCRG